MNHQIKFLMLSALIAVSAQAIADDTSADDMPKTSADKTQMMKDCMAKQKAQNTSMTHEAMKTVCKNEVDKQSQTKNGNDLATGPQANKP